MAKPKLSDKELLELKRKKALSRRKLAEQRHKEIVQSNNNVRNAIDELNKTLNEQPVALNDLSEQLSVLSELKALKPALSEVAKAIKDIKSTEKVSVSNLGALISAVEKNKPKSTKTLEQAFKKLAKAVQDNKAPQDPKDFVPMRRVIKVGNVLQFDDSPATFTLTNSGGGGSSDGLTDAQLRATPVDISADNLPLPDGASTSAKQDSIISAINALEPSSYGIQAISDDGTYKYFFFEDNDANYYILRKHIANKVFDYTAGTGGYSSVYQDATSGPSGSPTWGDKGTIF